jgi:hypothetical protein
VSRYSLYNSGLCPLGFFMTVKLKMVMRCLISHIYKIFSLSVPKPGERAWKNLQYTLHGSFCMEDQNLDCDQYVPTLCSDLHLVRHILPHSIREYQVSERKTIVSLA